MANLVVDADVLHDVVPDDVLPRLGLRVEFCHRLELTDLYFAHRCRHFAKSREERKGFVAEWWWIHIH